jgi:hypothetical protein
MKNITKKLLIGLLPGAISLGSCKKLIQIPPNAPNQLVTAQVFGDSADAIAGVVNLYTRFSGATSSPGSLVNGGITLYTALSGDELNYTGSRTNLQSECYKDVIPSNDNTNSNLWYFSYGDGNGIYQTNACIAGLTASTGISASLKTQLIGECEVMRAFYYFNMYYIWGGVPLVTTTNYQVNESLPKADSAAIFTQIINDLKDAQQRLTIAYPSTGRARPNLYTATALLAKAYLFQQDYPDAYTQANSLIGSGIYNLVADPNQVFLDGSTEAIWQVPAYGTISNYPTTEGYLFVPYSSTTLPPYVLSSAQLSAFESGDLRLADWVSLNTIRSVQYYYPYKYKNYEINGNATDEDYMVFRLAEQYLIRAEAQAQGAGNGLAGAIADLNMIRSRAQLGNYAGTAEPAAVLAAIMHERQVELFCEWGNRWMDLKRTGMIDVILNAEKPGSWPSDGHAALFPIPTDQLQLDPFLVQNPGY